MLFRIRRPPARIDFSNAFNPELDDATAIERFRFTIHQLQYLADRIVPEPRVVTKAGDSVLALEALAIVCRRLSESSILFTAANEFGRSTSAMSRLFLHSIRLMYR
ncbi:hypothetical protein SPRG_13226, partial [Saprolegnia parasitica CBS 223.65]